MNELSLYILDLVQNSVSAGADHVEILITVSDEEDFIEIILIDDGCGMSEEFLKNVVSPFTTTRKTRKVGLGLPLLKMTAEMTGGMMDIQSAVGVGTVVTATFGLGHIDRPPLGDVAGAWFSLVVMNPEKDFLFTYDYDGQVFTFDTREVRETVKPIPLNQMEISAWIKDCISTEINELHGGNFT